MSYILDALTKSQQQRTEAPGPTLTTPQLMPASPRRAFGSHGVALALASVAVLLSIYLLMSNPRDRVPSTTTREVSATQFDETRGSSPPAVLEDGQGGTIQPIEPLPSRTELDARTRAARDANARDRRPMRPAIEDPAATTGDALSEVSRAAPQTPSDSTPARDADGVGEAADMVTARRSSASPRERAATAQARAPMQPIPEQTLPSQVAVPTDGDRTQESPSVIGSGSNLTKGSEAAPDDASRTLSPETKRLLDGVLALNRRYMEEARTSGASRGAQGGASSDDPGAGDRDLVTGSQRPAMPPAEAENASLQLFELSEGFQQALRSLKINVHVYAEVPSERLVMINMKRYREGAQLEEGPRIEAITATGAILSYQSERYHLKAR